MTNDLRYEDVKEGMQIPPYSIPLTLQRLVMEAGTNRDFAPMHYDRDLARASGQQDVFANTMLLQTLFEVMLRQWMGLAGRVRQLGFRMLRPNYLGETVVARGTVTERKVTDGRGIVSLEVWQETEAHGRTVSGSAVVEVPLHER